VAGICDWLTQQGLEQYSAVFTEHEITLDVLANLTESDIDCLGLPTGPRRRLIVAIRALAPATRPQSLVPHSHPTAEPSIVSHAVDRRQLTVMFCDMVGSTELAHRLDPEQLRELMHAYYQSCREVVARYSGHVAQYWGDGLMVYFGWPSAHEDDAERGVRAALEMVDAVKELIVEPPLRVRIGVATGTVVVGQTPSDDNAQAELAVGETPNLASRLQGLAGPDEVIVAASTRHLIGGHFELSDLGAHSLKGIPREVHAWRIHAVRRAVGRFDATHGGEVLTPMVGRKEEISRLSHGWRQACRGNGQVVLVRGEPGIGKSRLTRTFREQLVKTSYTVVRYQCSQFHLNSPLYPVTEQIEYAARFARDDTSEQKLDKLKAVMLGDPAERAEAASLIAALFALPVSRYASVALSPQKQKERTLEVLVGQLRSLCQRKPVLIVFEDAQWIDPTSQDLVDALIPQVKEMFLFMIITFRPEYTPHWVEQSHVATLSLDPLEQREGAELVNNVTEGKSLPREVLDNIVARTDGVPLFLEELTKSVLESGMLRAVGDQYALQDPELAQEIPTSLRDSLLARLDRLSSVKSVIEIGACIGREFSFDLLARISSLHREELEEGLRMLTEAGLVYSRGAPRHATYAFKHALVQDVAYDSLLKTKRHLLHARIARVLQRDFADRIVNEPESLAHHLTQAGDLVAALPWWCEAGKLAMRRAALREAVSHFKRGLVLIEQIPCTPERDALELSIRQPFHASLVGLRGWPAAEVTENGKAILELVERSGDRQALGVGLWVLWANTITQGRVADSLEWSQRMLTEGDQSGDNDLLILGNAGAMISYFYLGELIEARARGERVLALYDPRNAARLMQLTAHDFKTVVGTWACQWTWMLGYPDEAVRISDEKDDYARQLGHPFNLGFALSLGAYAFGYRSEPGRLLERVAEADRLEQKHSVPFVNQVMVRQAEGLARLRNGQYPEAIFLLQNSLESWNKYGGHSRVPYLKSALAEAVARNGDLDQALTILGECLEQIERPGWQERSHLAEVLRLKGWLLMHQGKSEAAEVALRASIDWARQQQAKSWELRSTTTLAGLLASRGERAAARAILEPIYSWFTEGFDTHDLKAAQSLIESLK
jgi:class 3 adenylate cyclase/tetratricopeptide (TPR) repeat protein